MFSQQSSADPDHINSPSAFFNTALTAFKNAETATGLTVERFYMIGGHTVRLCFAGRNMISLLTPALEHLNIADCSSEPSLTVCLFDSASSGAEMPRMPWQHNNKSYGNGIQHYQNGSIHIAFQADAKILNIMDSSINTAVFWAHDSSLLPYYECGAPLRKIFHWWMLRHNRQLIHAAAVGTPEGGVLLAGKSGSGKSTCALSCLNSQLSYLSDDYCLVETKPVPYAYGLYNSAKIEKNNLGRFPELKSFFCDKKSTPTGKNLLFLHRHYPDNLLYELPILAILLPRISGNAETALRSASPAGCLTALAPSTIFQLPGAGRKSLQIMSELIRKVPSYSLDLGSDTTVLPGLILNLLTLLKNNGK